MVDFIEELRAVRESGTPAVLCIVTSASGNVPRKAGAKMLVMAGGNVRGTIGGGVAEHQAVQTALQVLGKGLPLLQRFEAPDELLKDHPGSLEVYFEPIYQLPRLYIFGAGHVGRALAAFSPAFGFRTTVVDCRPGIVAAWNVPETEIIPGNYAEVAATADFNESSYIVIATHSHEMDAALLISCAPRTWAYLGMIGSKRKVAEVRKQALEQQISPDILERIDMPIGIPFAAETPAEIAVSILARLIDVKNRRKSG